VEDLPANVHISQLRRYFPRREVDWLPEEDDTKSQQAEPSGSEQFKSCENQQFASFDSQQVEPSGSEQFKPSENQLFESSESQQFEPKQLPVPFVSRVGRAVLPKTSDHNFIYY
jgi:hypothetical protein